MKKLRSHTHSPMSSALGVSFISTGEMEREKKEQREGKKERKNVKKQSNEERKNHCVLLC